MMVANSQALLTLWKQLGMNGRCKQRINSCLSLAGIERTRKSRVSDMASAVSSLRTEVILQVNRQCVTPDS